MAIGNAVCRWKFEAVQGYFVDLSQKFQHDPSFRATNSPRLGLIERRYDTDEAGIEINGEKDEKPWQRFSNYIDHLNRQSPEHTIYKVLYITRHAQGYHNTFEAEVGHDAWNDYWSHLDGDGKIVWADAHLNKHGVDQATSLGNFWSKAIFEDGIPIPGTVYSSPLARCMETACLAFSKAFKEAGKPFRPVVKELLRERLTDHTCDRRSSRSWIEQNYPNFQIEPGFSEEDTLWKDGSWETEDEHTARKQQVLEEIFTTDGNAFVALITHSYAISAILSAVGCGKFRVDECGCVALLIRADKVGFDMQKVDR